MAARQAMTALLVLDQVRLQVAGRTLVDGLSLEICAGQRWAVLGPNGAGKSTLLAVLAGARPAEGGQVTTGGRALRTLDELELARLRALVADRWIDPFASSVIDTVLTARYSLPRDLNGNRRAALASHALLSNSIATGSPSATCASCRAASGSG
jgi:iron complex transport system ATP-binding protein